MVGVDTGGVEIPRAPIIVWGENFNVTVEIEDRPHGDGGGNLSSEASWAFILGVIYRKWGLSIMGIH